MNTFLPMFLIYREVRGFSLSFSLQKLHFLLLVFSSSAFLRRYFLLRIDRLQIISFFQPPTLPFRDYTDYFRHFLRHHSMPPRPSPASPLTLSPLSAIGFISLGFFRLSLRCIVRRVRPLSLRQLIVFSASASAGYFLQIFTPSFSFSLSFEPADYWICFSAFIYIFDFIIFHASIYIFTTFSP